MCGCEHLLSQMITPGDLAPALTQSAGLRNRIVHEYDALIESIILDAVKKLYPQ